MIKHSSMSRMNIASELCRRVPERFGDFIHSYPLRRPRHAVSTLPGFALTLRPCSSCKLHVLICITTGASSMLRLELAPAYPRSNASFRRERGTTNHHSPNKQCSIELRSENQITDSSAAAHGRFRPARPADHPESDL